MQRVETTANVVGLLVLAVEMALPLAIWVMKYRGESHWVLMFFTIFTVSYLVAAAISMFLWQSKRWPQDLMGCMWFVLLFAVAAAVFGGWRMLLGAYSPLLEKYTAVCIGLTMTSVVGAARAWWLQSHDGGRPHHSASR